MEFSAIALVAKDRWITCTANENNPLNLKPGGELKLEKASGVEFEKTAFNDLKNGRAILLKHQVPKRYDFKSLVSVPVYRQDGIFFGILFAMDAKSNQVNIPEINGMFHLFANLISFHLQEVGKMRAANAKIKDDLNNSKLRDQIIAILGHDLKNPIATMRMSSDILLKFAKEELVQRQAKMIKSSSFRMEGLIDNILDYAREQMGEGINPLKKTDPKSLEKALEQVIKELRTISPDRQINVNIDFNKDINGDENRISQLFSNLLTYADIHGHDNEPIEANVITGNGEFHMSVRNFRNKISNEEMAEIFQPFYHIDSNPEKIGLNLGLYISSEIAKAHNGSLTVISTDEQTEFTFKMPLN